MEFQINISSLIDSPYSKTNDSLFSFNDSQIENFTCDLIHGHQTCYLVSGYRGVGKTSLVKRVEENICKVKIDEESDEKKSNVVFVYSSFAGYKKDNHLVRKLVRELYLKIDQNEDFKNLDDKLDSPSNLKDRLRLMYLRTFNDISEGIKSASLNEKQFLFDFSIKDLVLEFIKNITPLLLLFLSTPLSNILELQWVTNLVLPIGAIIWALINVFNYKYSFSRISSHYKSLETRTLFDDEIAETLFLDVLKIAKQKGFKIVFVIDELDKVDPVQINDLIFELKTYLVSGSASFIVVGGQDLYYKFHEDSEIDDAVLSSLFSKIYHVGLSSKVRLKNIFYNQIIAKGVVDKLDEDGKIKLDLILDYFIYQSRLIPRRFINIIRREIVWNNGIAYISYKEDIAKAYHKIVIEAIDKIDDTKISTQNSGAIRDFIIMYLYINCLKKI